MTQNPPLPRLPWREDFATGIASVDHEHKELIDLINLILEKLEGTEVKQEVADFLGEVYARIAAHFALEEQIMRDRRYDQYDDHKTDHERLLDDIRDIMDAYEDGSYTDRRQAFAKRLGDWFVVHFKTKDARFHNKLGA